MTRKGYDLESKEMKQLLKEKEEMYKCDMQVIDKILNIYGNELKETVEGV